MRTILVGGTILVLLVSSLMPIVTSYDIKNNEAKDQDRGIEGHIYTYYGQPARYYELTFYTTDPVNGSSILTTTTNAVGYFSFIVDWPVGTEYELWGYEGTYVLASGTIIDGIIYDDIYHQFIDYISLDCSDGWNFVSIPCDWMYVGGTLINGYTWENATTNNNPTGSPIIIPTFFSWDKNAQSYFIVHMDGLGGNTDGTWIFSYTSCDIEFLVLNIPLGWDVDLRQGWNTLGGLWYDYMTKNDFVIDWNYTWGEAVSLGLISDYVFGWHSSSQSYYFPYEFNTYEAYWIFAYEDCILEDNL